MKQYNKVFKQNGETPYEIKVPWYGKKVSRVVGIREIADGIFAGTVAQNKKITGTWCYNMHKYDMPVFRSHIIMVNGKPKRYTKNSICYTIKELVQTYIDEQAQKEVSSFVNPEAAVPEAA